MLNKKALAASVSAPPAVYIEDVFSTYLYTGNDSTQTINNGIDLAGKGGLVWVKNRVTGGSSHLLWDTAQGGTLSSDATGVKDTFFGAAFSSSSSGFNLASNGYTFLNKSGLTYCSWTFREQAKFFDIVTYTGNGVTTGRTINHNLGSVPGMMILKVTDLADDWYVYHRSIPTSLLALNLTNDTGSPPTTPATIFGNGTTTVAPTSTQVTIGGTANANGYTYVLYLYAHDAGGFGASGTDNVISCGSFSSSLSSGGTINLGYEPQYIFVRNATSAANWIVVDSMRGIPNVDGATSRLFPNSSGAEDQSGRFNINATGFSYLSGTFADGNTIIYMAIRRPMKPPTSGTSVFNTIARTGTGSTVAVTGAGFPPDMALIQRRNGGGDSGLYDRLRGANTVLYPQYTLQEYSVSSYLNSFDQDGITLGTDTPNISGHTFANWFFKRASGFFDEVCYTGTGSARTVAHNLTVVPELMIVKQRNIAEGWSVYSAPTGNTKYLRIYNTDASITSSSMWNNTTPTSSVFTVGTNSSTNDTGGTYVAYLFATLAGVSKVGSYTGNGGTQAIACGFTGGARFVLIKRTDSTGDWYVYDTVRGMTLLTDPYLLINSGVAESATLGSVTTTTGGFTVDATILAAINTNAASYTFLAIA